MDTSQLRPRLHNSWACRRETAIAVVCNEESVTEADLREAAGMTQTQWNATCQPVPTCEVNALAQVLGVGMMWLECGQLFGPITSQRYDTLSDNELITRAHLHTRIERHAVREENEHARRWAAFLAQRNTCAAGTQSLQLLQSTAANDEAGDEANDEKFYVDLDRDAAEHIADIAADL